MAFMPFPQLRRQQPVYRQEPRGGINIDASGGSNDDMGLMLAMIQMQLGQQENTRRGRIEEGQLAIQQQLANAQLEQQKFALEEAARARTAAQYAPILDRVQRRAASSVGKQIEELRTTYSSAGKDNAVVALNKDIVRAVSDYQENPSAANREKLQGLMADAIPRRMRGIAESANANGEFALRGAIGAVAPTISTLGSIVETDEELRKTYNSLRLNLDPMLKFADPSALQNRLGELERGVTTRMDDVILGISEEAQRVLNDRDALRITDAEARNRLNKLGMSRIPRVEEAPVNPFKPYDQLESLFSVPERVAGDPSAPERLESTVDTIDRAAGRLWSGTPDRVVGGGGQAAHPQPPRPFASARELMNLIPSLLQYYGSGPSPAPAAAPLTPLAFPRDLRQGNSYSVDPPMSGDINTATVLQALLANPGIR